ncbi:hypothetical protein [Ruminococcus albus]|uniref:Zinc finger domain protein, LSD1 subclass n=1 Tax=Ruminococcus albus 8 TaxID=246199 RepID=E9SBC5_RUMAL|nr:hypothetical protein [Ruminococcus albus]EGC03455.1 zinc finger domain protein, LSD1 subclass [Ruminococcus albus 8]MCC3350271.1 hypothetical protein [Ruminococcus albus 8]
MATSTQLVCPNCAGTLQFDPTIGKMKCIFCDSVFSQEEAEQFFAQQNEEEEIKESGADWGEDADGMRAYSCSTCGAEILCDQNTAATRCPYCDNTTVIEAQLSGAIKPDVVIPFAFTKEQAMEKYKGYYEKRKLIPKDFLSGSRVEEIQGVYVPFWLYDGSVSIDAEFEAADITDNGTEITRKIYKADRRGNIAFENVPADASKRMPDDIMDSVEPFDFGQLKPFSMTYMPGFLAERFDVEGDDDLERAEKRVTNTAKQKTRATVRHDEVTETRGDYKVNYTKKKYALLPIWYLTTSWNGKQWNFAMNGQTGNFTGDLPVDGTKLGIMTGGSALAAAVLLYLITKSIPFILGAALVVGLIVFLVAKGSMKPVHKATQANEYMAKKVSLVYSTDDYVRTERKKKEQRQQS